MKPLFILSLYFFQAYHGLTLALYQDQLNLGLPLSSPTPSTNTRKC